MWKLLLMKNVRIKGWFINLWASCSQFSQSRHRTGKIVEPDEAVEMDPEPEQLMHGVCLFVSKNRQNGFADRAQFFCWTSCDCMWPKERLMEDRVFKYLPLTKFVFANFEIQQIFLRNPQHFCLFLFYNVYIEKMFTIKIKYRCEEALKPSIIVRQFQKY